MTSYKRDGITNFKFCFSFLYKLEKIIYSSQLIWVSGVQISYNKWKRMHNLVIFLNAFKMSLHVSTKVILRNDLSRLLFVYFMSVHLFIHALIQVTFKEFLDWGKNHDRCWLCLKLLQLLYFLRLRTPWRQFCYSAHNITRTVCRKLLKCFWQWNFWLPLLPSGPSRHMRVRRRNSRVCLLSLTFG